MLCGDLNGKEIQKEGIYVYDGFSKAVGFGQGLLTFYLGREGQEQPVFLDPYAPSGSYIQLG